MHLLHGCQTGDLGPGQASNWSTTQGPRTEDKLQEQSVLPRPIQPCLRRPYCFLRPCLSFWKPGVAAIIPQVPSPSAWPKEAGPEAPDSPAPPAKLPSPAPEALIRLSASALGQFVFPAGLLRSTPVCACLVALVMSNSL